MRVLAGAGIVAVTKSHCRREPPDGAFFAGQEMPARGRVRAAIDAHIHFLFRGGQAWCVFRVETDGQHLELFSHVKLQGLERFEQTVFDHGAEHRAIEIDQRKNDGLRAEIIRKTDRPPDFVAKYQVERDLVAEILVNADIFQDVRPRVGRLRACQRGNDEKQQSETGGRAAKSCCTARTCHPRTHDGKSSVDFLRAAHILQRFLPVLLAAAPVAFLCEEAAAEVGKPRATRISMARSIGIRATPAFSSTHP